jgi:hypothetical protein
MEGEIGGESRACREEQQRLKIVVGRSEVKRQLGRLKRVREDNIKMNRRQIRLEFVDWFNLFQDR